MDTTEVDSALLLEDALRKRVNLIVGEEVERIVVNQLGRIIEAERNRMLNEAAVKIEQMIRVYEKEGFKPLREATKNKFELPRKR